MNTRRFALSLLSFIFTVTLLLPSQLFSQIVTNLKDTTTQSEYIIITPGAYAAPSEQLAAFRSTHSGLSAKLVIVDSIYRQFTTTSTADSAIREFIRYAIVHWKNPKPKYFLFAGNVNVIPSHKEEGLQLGQFFIEDSIMVDQWFAENPVPLSNFIASIGRFPAWDLAQLQTMVTKTIAYQTTPSASWMNRAVVIADSIAEDSTIFEVLGKEVANYAYPAWKDTVLIHVRLQSPNHLSTESFRELWNNGAGMFIFLGEANDKQFSRERYFSKDDVSFLSNGDKLPICLFATGGLRFEKNDTTGLVVDLLKRTVGGGVATIGGSGAVYVSDVVELSKMVVSSLALNSAMTLGDAMLSGMNRISSPFSSRRMTLLGDPALTIRRATTMAVKDPTVSPEQFALHQNFPNPFNPSTTIRFTLPSENFVSLKVYNMLGQEVATLVNDMRFQGTHSVTFNASSLSAGAYVYRLQAGNFSNVKKLMLIK